MSNRRQKHESPRGPEGVPVDAPGNDGPALSPHAVSRTHRAEDDREALEHSPDFSDQRSTADDERSETERWVPGAPGSGGRDDASRGLDATNAKPEPNPGHRTSKPDTEPPRGLGDGELMEQPGSQSEARQKP
jgi:hypothetical protein